MRHALRGRDAVFAGYRFGEELARIYASADLFVFPSATDTLGQVVMESQSCGLAALVSDVGGPREMVLAGRTGLVLPAADVRHWVEAIVALVRDEPRRRAMGVAAARHMRQFSIERSFEDWWAAHERAARG
jgi:glycosyltransferase involved in cell wall biosynthesis